MIYKNKAFTLSEVLLALTIIGVVMALVIPVAINSVSDTSGLQFKKAYTDIQNAVTMALERTETYTELGADSQYYFLNMTPENFCKAVAGELTTVGTINCKEQAATPDAGNPNFQMVNGFSFWNVGGTGTTTFYNDTTPCTESSYSRQCTRLIWLDVNGANKGKNTYGKDRFKMLIRYDGKVLLGTGDDWEAEEDILVNEKY